MKNLIFDEYSGRTAVPYAEILENYNELMAGNKPELWKEIVHIIGTMPRAYCKKYQNIKSRLNLLLNNYIIESELYRTIEGMEYGSSVADHETLHCGLGVKVADFMYNGIPTELKSYFKVPNPNDKKVWHDAEVKLWFNKQTKILYGWVDEAAQWVALTELEIDLLEE